MSISREQVADLQPGDVVEIRDDRHPDVVTRGPLHDEGGSLVLGDVRVLRWGDGGVPSSGRRLTLTVVSRAPRPLYVNSDRTEPVTGDVVGDAEPGHPRNVWLVNADDADQTWFVNSRTEWLPRSHLPTRLRLLVDGKTGTAVTS